ncbi:hypothetical protein AB0I10_21570 [Streptomyces sp. NPDC050636]|uniref:hypothetical protein n=1 Tax=Streptomyces sp. NPDC050636 TaxID=3154510 RepID=UPI003441D5F7
MLRRTAVILSGLVVSGFLASGAATAATADRYDPEDSSPYSSSNSSKDQKAASPGKVGERIYPGSLADLLNGVLGGRTY